MKPTLPNKNAWSCEPGALFLQREAEEVRLLHHSAHTTHTAHTTHIWHTAAS